VEGLPADVNLVKLIEESAPDDAKLNEHLDIYDTCGKEKCTFINHLAILHSKLCSANDPCETSAKVFKCGVDKDPAGMTNLIETSSKNKAAEAAVCNILVP